MTPPHEHETPEHSQEHWDARYAATDALWSGRPNTRLVENVSGRPPGLALEVGCGEGADAIWLAGQGWTVTAVDVSQVALDRAAGHAEQAGSAVAARITWRREDLRTWIPEPESHDLVTEHFLHLPVDVRVPEHQGLAAAVRPGGMLLLVGHHPADNHRLHRQHPPEYFFTPQEEADRLSLAPAEWDVTASSPTRTARDRDGNELLLTDAVLRAVRRGG